MKLLKLELNNFKAIKEFTFEPNGEDKSIFGKNGVGKTTLVDAYFWVLVGKSSTDKKVDDDIKLKDNTGNPQLDNGLEHKVSAILELDNGTQVTLSKIYQEKWTKNHGKPIAEFDGHTTTYLINDVSRSQKDYNTYIEQNIGSIEILKMLSSATYFCNMPWKKQRELLLEVCGDITDMDVINSDERLKDLPSMLESKNVNDFITLITQRKTKLNSQLNKIPTRIDENKKMLDDSNEENEEIIETELKDFRKKKNALENKLTTIKGGYAVAHIERQIAQIDTKIEQIKQQYNATNNADVLELQKQKSTKEIDLQKQSQQLTSKKNEQEILNNKIASISKQIEDCRNAWKVEKKKVFSGDNICPTCGQALPQEKINEAIEKFNKTKAYNLKACTEAGTNLAHKKQELEHTLQDNENTIATLVENIDNLNKNIQELDLQIIDKQKNIADIEYGYMSNPEYKNLYREKVNLKKELISVQDNCANSLKQYQSQIEQIDLDINVRTEKLAKIKQLSVFKNRIEDLKAEQKQLGEEFNNLEFKLNLAQIFTKNKVNMLTDKINSKFKITKFKLFNQQVNGLIDDTCEAMTQQGSTYGKSMSNGEKIIIGLDICNTLAQHYKLDVPIWIDNAESVSELLKANNSQMFNLVVAHHDELKIKDPILKRF
ncbi:ATP-binding protein [Megamonas funiformis]|uniref:ATP-binding protein n=1 Tax=Megamonas funiformis TaxID=437897 RepID=UPI002675F490|nr:ATP-binding protein [Megamonas funiformis]